MTWNDLAKCLQNDVLFQVKPFQKTSSAPRCSPWFRWSAWRPGHQLFAGIIPRKKHQFLYVLLCSYHFWCREYDHAAFFFVFPMYPFRKTQLRKNVQPGPLATATWHLEANRASCGCKSIMNLSVAWIHKGNKCVKLLQLSPDTCTSMIYRSRTCFILFVPQHWQFGFQAANPHGPPFFLQMFSVVDNMDWEITCEIWIGLDFCLSINLPVHCANASIRISYFPEKKVSRLTSTSSAWCVAKNLLWVFFKSRQLAG